MRKIGGYFQLAWLSKSPPALFSRLFELAWYRTTLELWIAPILTSNAAVLEIGCAGGDFSRSLAERGINVWGVDRSWPMIAKSKEKPSRAQFVQADATLLPFPDQYFDAVVAASLINIVASPLDLLKEMQRVCRREGTVSVLAPAQTFSAADAKRYREEKRLTGFSSAAFTAWNSLGRKMDAQMLRDYFEECGLMDISSRYLLDGMVVAIYGRVNSA